jgi:hypothetical protein
MPTLSEGKLAFSFPDGWLVSKYDEWSHYRNQANSICGSAKAIDFVAIELKLCCWLLEVKDYRAHPRTKVIDLADEVAVKVRDTLAALVGAQHHANDDSEKSQAQKAVRAPSIRVVLHLEQPKQHSKLFPRVIKPADVLQRLKQLLKAIDPHPRVVELNSMGGIPWQVTSL